MTERTQLILYFSVATFVIVVFIAVLLVRRHGHTTETAAIIRKVQQVDDHLEAFRGQKDAEDGALRAELRWIKERVLKIFVRFGFLDRNDQ